MLINRVFYYVPKLGHKYDGKEGKSMIKIVELEDGTFRITIHEETEIATYDEITRFQKIDNDPEILEKENGYRYFRE